MRPLVLTVSAVLVAARLGAAAPPWVEVKSPHFVVITNGGDGAGRRTAWQFEQIRSGLSSLWPWAKIDAGRPFVVFAVRDEATLKTLGPQYWEGKRFRPAAFSATGRDRQFVAIRTDIREPDDISANPYQTAYWSYANMVFTNAFPRRLPQWYSRGVAEVMSNTFVREKELHVGRLMQGNIDVMRERAPIPLAEFLSADRSSPWVTQETAVRLFDAQACSLVHYLLFSEKGRHAARVDRFNRLLYEGTAEDVALEEAFGDMTQQQATGSAGGLAEAMPARRETVSLRGPNPSTEGDPGERVAKPVAREMVLQIPRGVRPEVPEEVDLRAVAERDRERAATAV